MLAVCACVSSRAFNTPSGWTKILEFGNGTNRITVFGKVAVGGDVAGPHAFTLNATFGEGHAAILRVTGATSTIGDIVPDDGPGIGGSGSSAAGEDVTTVSADNLIVYGFTSNGSASAGPGGAWSEAFDNKPSVGKHLAVYTAAQANAGTVTGPTITLTFTSWAMGGVSIPPPIGGGSFIDNSRNILNCIQGGVL